VKPGPFPVRNQRTDFDRLLTARACIIVILALFLDGALVVSFRRYLAISRPRTAVFGKSDSFSRSADRPMNSALLDSRASRINSEYRSRVSISRPPRVLRVLHVVTLAGHRSHARVNSIYDSAIAIMDIALT
jgi:hypothetical protein